MRQQMMNPLNYKNYQDSMSSLPVYQPANQNAEVLQQLRESQELDSAGVVDYLLTTLSEIPTEEEQ